MESFYRTHQYLLSHLSTQLVRRGLMDEINWNERLIGIKGSRGIGKTTFLLSYAKEFYGINNRECLYINLNHFFFTEKTIVEFARDFRSQGGKTLLIDQVFKYPEWSKELRICYDEFPDLQIIFTGPSVMRLKEENPDLAGKVAVYQLRGFSFREYLNLVNDKQFPTYNLKDIIQNHQKIAKEIVEQTNHKLQSYFRDYLHHGFYPFFLEKRNYSENLLKTMNMTLEVDVLYIKQIEQRYLPKLRKLFYMISQEAPCTPNVSQLSKELEMSRATVMNYIKYLKDARLVNMLYPMHEDFPKKPSTVYVYNTNILHAVHQEPINEYSEYRTFFFNQLQKDFLVNEGIKYADFTIDNELLFCIKVNKSFKNNPKYYYIVNTNTSEKNVIPLWLFGFLY
ncbi:MAG: AAA family ATPase [Tannerella sp.]|nr:AAA family ATPase [Tannerella sp.]